MSIPLIANGFRVAGVGDPGRAARLQAALQRVPAVVEVRIHPAREVVIITYHTSQTTPSELRQFIRRQGFTSVEDT